MAISNRTDIHAFVAKGADKGTQLYPHRYGDGHYVVSMTRYKTDYVYIDDPAKLLNWLEKGFGLRMSNPEKGIKVPRLIKPQHIFRRVIL